MANYPQYNYQPQPMVYQPQKQPIYQQYQPPMQAPQAQMQQEQFFCRPVASADEARAIPVDFSGKPMVLPQLNAGRIYVKMFDQNSGSAIFREFRMYEEPAQEVIAKQSAAAYAPLGVVDQIRKLEETVAALQQELSGLKSRRTQTTEVRADDE